MQRITRITAAAVLLGVVSLAPLEVSAAGTSPCKGLEETKCGEAKVCYWIKAHKTAKGKDIAAYCRKKPEKKATQAEPAPKS
jgi:hypothetical protein